jgi:peroxiredoxin
MRAREDQEDLVAGESRAEDDVERIEGDGLAELGGQRRERDRIGALGATVAGLSVQTVDEQRRFAARVGLRFRLISDPELQLAATLGLPTFTAGERTFYRRLTLVAREGSVVKLFYPVPSPERNAADVLRWLRGEA